MCEKPPEQETEEAKAKRKLIRSLLGFVDLRVKTELERRGVSGKCEKCGQKIS